MKTVPTKIQGVWVLEVEPFRDERGAFARTYCEQEFKDLGLHERRWVQCATSQNHSRGTLRGLHYQAEPHAEAKLVRCTAGCVFDVVVDLRTKSPTWGQWISVELSRSNGRSILIPEGCAHGFQSLEDDSELCYMISNFYVPESARGVRWNDPAIRISWPIPDPILSERDGCWPLMPRLENPLQQALELARWQEAKPLPGGTRE